MSRLNALPEDESYAIQTGCPTLTFVIEDVEQTLPYHSFVYGAFQNDVIELIFSEGKITIIGKELRELWRHLQLQDVRLVTCNAKPEVGEVHIEKIIWDRSEEG